MNKHTRSFNVLIEMLICVCFFVTVTFVCVNVMVRSYKLNDKANHLQKAILHSDMLSNKISGCDKEGLAEYLDSDGYEYEDMIVKVSIIDKEESSRYYKYDFDISIYYQNELLNDIKLSKIGDKYE